MIPRHKPDKEINDIAFSFTSDSYLTTRLVANLVHVWKLVQDWGGSMGLIRPNADIVGVLKTIGLVDMISIYTSENDVGVK